MATPFNIADWIKFIALQVSNALSAPLPNEPILAFNAPLVATDDPNNSRTQISLSGVLAFTQTPIVSGTSSLVSYSGSLLVPFDASPGSMAITMPNAPDGTFVQAIDVGLATGLHTVTWTCTGSVKIQDPETMNLGTTYVQHDVRNITWTKITGTSQGAFWAVSP